ncbi:MAG TPA: dihydrofolate reductase family protein [Gemmatimonadaceae bacterium]|jgi:dihydrofolate reductase|nr:dihydrofolate reductase family protein [Gemmatimonadaceae bacterium]
MIKRPRKIVAYLAVSLDGYIARPDGDVEWLNRRPHTVDYGYAKFTASVDTILLGRGTYDWAVRYMKKHPGAPVFDSRATHYVFTRRPPRRGVSGVQFTSEPAKAFARRLRAQRGKNIWMMGGGQLIASFLDAGEIDEFDLHVIPVLIGKGIPLIAPRHRDIELRLVGAKKYADGVVRLRYEVPRRR